MTKKNHEFVFDSHLFTQLRILYFLTEYEMRSKLGQIM